jgi:hypothetical protein
VLQMVGPSAHSLVHAVTCARSATGTKPASPPEVRHRENVSETNRCILMEPWWNHGEFVRVFVIGNQRAKIQTTRRIG